MKTQEQLKIIEARERAKYAMKLANVEEARRRQRLPPLRFGNPGKSIKVAPSYRDVHSRLTAEMKQDARRREMANWENKSRRIHNELLDA